MRKLNRPQEPIGYGDAIARFVVDYPPNGKITESRRWNAFKNEEQEIYAAVKQVLFANQQGLCAFCECLLTATNREIEHFRPKSVTSATEDLTLDFSNFTMSCKGKRSPNEDDHCGHLKADIDPTERIICPYDLPPVPLVRIKHKEEAIIFVPDEDTCERHGISPDLIQQSLDLLGVNAHSLRQRRFEVWESLDAEIGAALMDFPDDELDEEFRSIISRSMDVAHGELKEFTTTRRLFFSTKLPDLYNP